MKNKVVRVFALLTLVVLVVAPLSTSVMAQDDETTLRIATAYVVSTLDPIKSIAAGDIEVFGQIYSRLLRLTPDGEIQPGLAESWEASDDEMQYTFHLRDAMFSDGSPITADDVVFTFLRLRDQEDSAYSGAFQVITEIEALDEKTVQFTLDAPNAPFLGNMEIFNTGIVPQAAVESMGDEEFGANPVGSGPYRVVEWIPGDRLILEANPYYWREGYPQIDNVEFITVATDTTRVAMLQAGEVEVASELPWANIDQLDADENINVPLDPSSVIYIILLNHNHEVVSDVRVRKAIGMGIDSKTITEVTTFGRATPANSPIPNTLNYYNPDAPGIPYDPEQAKALVEEAGATGAEIEFMVGAGSSFIQQYTLLVQDQLAAAGLTVTITEVDTGTWWDKLIGGDYGAAINWWYNETSDPDLAVRWALCGSCGTASYFTNYTNERLDELTEEAVRELDPDKRRDLYYEIQQIALDDVSQVPLFYKPFTHGYRANVEGLKMTPAFQWTIEEATIN